MTPACVTAGGPGAGPETRLSDSLATPVSMPSGGCSLKWDRASPLREGARAETSGQEGPVRPEWGPPAEWASEPSTGSPSEVSAAPAVTGRHSPPPRGGGRAAPPRSVSPRGWGVLLLTWAGLHPAPCLAVCPWSCCREGLPVTGTSVTVRSPSKKQKCGRTCSRSQHSVRLCGGGPRVPGGRLLQGCLSCLSGLAPAPAPCRPRFLFLCPRRPLPRPVSALPLVPSSQRLAAIWSLACWRSAGATRPSEGRGIPAASVAGGQSPVGKDALGERVSPKTRAAGCSPRAVAGPAPEPPVPSWLLSLLLLCDRPLPTLPALTVVPLGPGGGVALLSWLVVSYCDSGRMERLVPSVLCP